MPPQPTYPGVYIEEVSSGVHTITGVATSIVAFIGAALRGPVDKPERVHTFAEFERIFGGLWRSSPMTYAVNHYFQNGGSDAMIVRVIKGGAAATGSADTLNLEAASPGVWGEKLRIRVDHDTGPEVGTEELFSLIVQDTGTGVTERFLNVSMLAAHASYVEKVLAEESKLVRLRGPVPLAKPNATPNGPPGKHPMTVTPGSLPFNSDGDDGATITDGEVSDPALREQRRGLWALENADLFNLLCIPPFAFESGDIGAQTRTAAADYCCRRRAFYIVDPLNGWDEPSDLISGVASLDSLTWGLARTENAALYFPRLRAPDPLQEGRLAEFAPCGAVAGVYARTDSRRGVWKAPAGTEATLTGVSELTANLTDSQNGQLNATGVNCLRVFSGVGSVVWGSRTLRGADSLASEWKYVPVRRLGLFLEESLFRGTQWVVFEPNDEPLWAKIRLNVGVFMNDLYRQGAFQGRMPNEAYFVKCGSETMTQNDIDLGIVNIIVGFAPLKPAEFVILRIQLMAIKVEA